MTFWHKALFSIGLLAAIIAVATIRAHADGPVIKQSTCTISWTAPQTNADGTNLTDLKEYRVYYAPGLTVPAGGVPVAIVPAPAADPATGATGSWPCKTLPLGQGATTVTAADTAGNESVRPASFPFILADDVSPQAPQNLQVGP